jgi:quercetin 2,3-dioxygenase
MIAVRRGENRGHFNHGWLDTYHTFSFADYQDPDHMGFGDLRVINEDRVEPGQGFATHGHRDMEIVTYVLEGELEHRDSLGNGSVIRPGDVQRMSAGTGVRHSEHNPSKTQSVHLLQIWILPSESGLPPGYEQKTFAREDRLGRFRLIASSDGAQGSVRLHQDAKIHSALLLEGQAASAPLGPRRSAWLQVARGRIRVGGHELREGDGAAFTGESQVRVEALRPAEALLFDLRERA